MTATITKRLFLLSVFTISALNGAASYEEQAAAFLASLVNLTGGLVEETVPLLSHAKSEIVEQDVSIWDLEEARLIPRVKPADQFNYAWLQLPGKRIVSLKGLERVIDGVEALDLQHNQLTADALTDHGFSSCAGLKVLWLNYNPLKEVSSRMLEGLSALTDLQLSFCELTSVPSDLCATLKSLKLLGLMGNKLTELPVDFFSDARELLYVILNDNKIEQFAEGTFSPLSILCMVSLTGNPIAADKPAIEKIRRERGCYGSAIVCEPLPMSKISHVPAWISEK